jgi:glutathione peroxidase
VGRSDLSIATLAAVLLAAALPAQESRPASRPVNVHDLEVTRIDGTRQKLGDYAGKALLIVNVASECGYTPQYEGLQKLHERYAKQGFAVLGFPSNDFGKQEPGSDAEILEFCTSQYRVTFPMFSKIAVKGPDAAPLYRRLQEAGAQDGAVKWNFHKFLIGKDGALVRGFGTKVAPESPELAGAIEDALAGAGTTSRKSGGVKIAVVAFDGLVLPDGTKFSSVEEDRKRAADPGYALPPGLQWLQYATASGGEYVWFDPEFWGEGKPGFTDADFQDAKAGRDETRQRTIEITVLPARRDDFRRYTAKWVGQKMAILVDGKIVTAPILRSELSDQVVLSNPGGLSPEDQRKLIERLRRR